MSNVTTMSPLAMTMSPLEAFKNMTIEKRLMHLYHQEVDNNQILKNTIAALKLDYQAVDATINENMNNFFLILNAIIVFIVQVRK